MMCAIGKHNSASTRKSNEAVSIVKTARGSRGGKRGRRVGCATVNSFDTKVGEQHKVDETKGEHGAAFVLSSSCQFPYFRTMNQPAQALASFIFRDNTPKQQSKTPFAETDTRTLTRGGRIFSDRLLGDVGSQSRAAIQNKVTSPCFMSETNAMRDAVLVGFVLI